MRKNLEQCMKNAPPKERHCILCGKAFIVSYPHFAQKYCCAECQKSAERATWRRKYRQWYKSQAQIKPRTCKRCGEEFQAMYTQCYCADCLNSGDWYMTRLRDYRKEV